MEFVLFCDNNILYEIVFFILLDYVMVKMGIIVEEWIVCVCVVVDLIMILVDFVCFGYVYVLFVK